MSSFKHLFASAASKRARPEEEQARNDAAPKRPAFNPALLESAFYTGPVSYGGAGLSGTTSLYPSKFYDKKKIDVKVVPTKAEAPVGQIAKTICECLESYSSPIADARRAIVNNRPPSSQPRTFNTSSIFDTSRRSFLTDSPSTSGSRPHKTRELQIPNIAALSKIKKTNRCSNARAAILASMSSSLPRELDSYKFRSDAGTSSYKSKMKTKINSVRPSKIDEGEMAQPVHLQNIPLNITSLPTFGESPFSLTAATSKYTAPVKKDSTSAAVTSSVVSVENNFKFTSPLNAKSTETSKPIMKFNFSEPVDIFNPRHVEKLAKSETTRITPTVKSCHRDFITDTRTSISNDLKFSKPDLPPVSVNFKASDSNYALKKVDKVSPELWNGGVDVKKKETEKSSLLNGDISHSSSGKRSHSDVDNESSFVDSDENANIKKVKPVPPASSGTNNSLESLIKKQQQMWECSSCLTRNDQSKDKCVSCEVPKPGATPSKPSVAVSTPNSGPASSFTGFGSFVKKQQEQWECPSCMTRNEQSKNKCVYCEATKPGMPSASIVTPKASKPATTTTSFSGFGNFMKKQQEQWECSCCLTRNDHNRNKCACCEVARPGSEPPAAAAATFNFGNPQNTFKFGIDKADSAKTSDAKVPEIKPSQTSMPATSLTFGSSVDSKTGNGTIGGFKFGVPSTTSKTAESSTPPKATFSFGEKKENTPASPVGSFTFGVKLSTSGALPGSSTVTDAKTNTFTFGSVQKDSEPKSETIIPKPEEKKEVNFLPITQSVAVSNTSSTVAPSEPNPMFTFGSAAQSKTEITPSKSFQFGSPTNKSSPTSTDSFAPKKSFVFGQISAETKLNTDLAPKASFQMPSSNTGSLFPSVGSTPAQGIENRLPGPLSGIQFTPSQPAEKPKEQQPPPSYFTFGSAASESSSANTFKSPVSNVPTFSFGSVNTSKPESRTLFNPPTTTSAPTLFGAKSAEQSLTSSSTLFKAPTSATPTFGSPATNMFKPATDSASPSTNVFGSSGLGQSGAKPAAMFGAPSEPSTQSTASPFSNPSVPPFGAGNIFASAGSSSNVSAMPGNMFSNLNKPAEVASNMFSAPPGAPTNIFASTAATPHSTNPIFGSSPSVPTPVFGASIPFGEASQNQPQQNMSFKFGSSSSSQTPFGQAPAAGSSAPVFSFGSGAAAPPTSSQFNFSMGAPSSAQPTQRKFKKAVRRSNVR